MSVLLDVDPVFGYVETMQYDHASGMLTIRREQDISAILDANVDAQNNGISKGEEGDFWHAASIPLNVLYDWMREFNQTHGRVIVDPYGDDAEWERFLYGRLDDSSFRKLRTGLFNIGR